MVNTNLGRTQFLRQLWWNSRGVSHHSLPACLSSVHIIAPGGGGGEVALLHVLQLQIASLGKENNFKSWFLASHQPAPRLLPLRQEMSNFPGWIRAAQIQSWGNEAFEIELLQDGLCALINFERRGELGGGENIYTDFLNLLLAGSVSMDFWKEQFPAL